MVDVVNFTCTWGYTQYSNGVTMFGAIFGALNSLPWVRPALFTVASVATLISVVAHPNTIAYHIAQYVLTAVVPLAAGSVGQSNSGLTAQAAPK